MTLFLLFLTGLFAGTVDAIAGGGGLITLPVLLSLGLPPQVALGTNKLQGTMGTLIATHRYYRHGLISGKGLYQGVLFGAVGAFIGALAWQVLSGQFLGKIIPLLLCIILLYTIFSPRLGDHDHHPRMREPLFYIIFGFGLGFYDGFFGPGTGSFWVFALTFCLGYNLIKATAYTKLFNLNSSFIATLCFMLGGNIDYRFALCMAAGQIIGGRIGAHLAITKGARLIRPLFLAVVSVTIASMMYKSYLSSSLFVRINHQYGMAPHVLLAMAMLSSVILIYMLANRRVKSQTT